ncbi:hypothetical protein N7G274_005511 [Stereocaulon virgatum]|uniref:Uncharacterized protein n=1 Tax=Stereocaulon virgatum TaxID=373712 RepID=A0ABR4A733_9LECA
MSTVSSSARCSKTKLDGAVAGADKVARPMMLLFLTDGRYISHMDVLDHEMLWIYKKYSLEMFGRCLPGTRITVARIGVQALDRTHMWFLYPEIQELVQTTSLS